ncbi:MAG: hypothetical protein KGZ79_11575 [Dethiobacter sp.]|jgi:hypothetical protein|nr:hypothetical protein [Dethiobacter sp.]
MARAPLTAAMVGKTVGRMCSDGKLTAELRKHGESTEQVFAASHKLKAKYGQRFNDIPAGAVGVYTYLDRLTTGLQQLMCGARKFSPDHISREDLVSLTQEGSQVTGLPYVMDVDSQEVEQILGPVQNRFQKMEQAG